jgi:hypothetical protein
MFRQVIFVSVCSWVDAGTVQKDQQSLIQAAIEANGEVFMGGEKLDVDEFFGITELSQMRVEHHFEDDVFHLSLHHNDGIAMFQMQEHHLFGEGIKEYGKNETMKILQPSFRTFKTVGGPHARVQLNGNGELHGWLTLNGRLLQVEKKHHAENEASIQYLQHTLNKNGKGHLKKFIKNGPDEVNGHIKGHIHQHKGPDGKHIYVADNGCFDSENKGCKHGEGIMENKNLLQIENSDAAMWGGTKWYPGCYSDDDKPHVMQVGVLIDNVAKKGDDWNKRRGYQYHGGKYDSEIAYQFNQANMIYQNQMNIELKVGFTITYADDAAPSLFDSTCAAEDKDIGKQLNQVVAFINGGLGGKANKGDVVSTHMFTGCNPSGYGTVGLAYVGVLCSRVSGYGSGVNHMNSGWTTFAH